MDHKTYGKAHEYFPLVPKDEYAKFYFDSFLGRYFDGSFHRLLSFFHKEGELKLEDMDQMLDQLREDKQDES